MVRGIESFRKWFLGFEEQYVIIGGTACDLLMNNEGLDFRATKDIDLVLIIESTDSAFGNKFWEYISNAGYEHRNKNTDQMQFYRFTNPVSNEYPAMLELFSRKPNNIILPKDAVLSPLPIDENVSSLSAILLNQDYYEFLKYGRTLIDGITVLDALHLIPFKAKAWIDLSNRKKSGEHIDSKSIKKHKNDVFRLYELLIPGQHPSLYLPESIKNDISEFIEKMNNEEIDLNNLGLRNLSKDAILDELREIYRV